MNPFLILIIIHFIGDFLFQNDRMAIGKSKSVYWLTVHVSVYSVILLFLGSFLIKDSIDLVCFVGINFVLHWITDFFTSKLTTYLYLRNEKNPQEKFLFNSWRHWFFVCIGIDQCIHYSCLFFTYQYFIN